MTGDDLPKKARGREYSAVVVVAFRLDGSGLAIDPSVVHSSPAGLFDKTTLELFARTRFAPGVVEGSCHFLRTYSAVLRRKQAN